MGWFSKLFKRADTRQPAIPQQTVQIEDTADDIATDTDSEHGEHQSRQQIAHPQSLENSVEESGVISHSTPKPVVIARPCIYKTAHLQGYVVLDFETTGLSPTSDNIIEIAALKIDKNGNELESFSTLVNPLCSIPGKITQLTGITDDMLCDAPCILEVIGDLYAFLGEYPIVAHNAPFDISFLKAVYQKAGITAELHYIDTVNLAKQAYPGMPNYKLATLIQKLGIANTQDHRALSDVYQTHILFQKCVNQIAESKNTVTPYESYELSDQAFKKGYKYWSHGEAERINGNIDAAFELYDKARDVGYQYPCVYESYAKGYRKLKDYEKEIMILDEAIQLFNSPEVEDFVTRKERAQALMDAQKERDAAAVQKALDKEQKAELRRKKKEEEAAKPKKSCKRAVIQYTDDGTIIKEFESVASAAQESGVSPKSIRDAANGVQKHAGGFCWGYADVVENDCIPIT